MIARTHRPQLAWCALKQRVVQRKGQARLAATAQGNDGTYALRDASQGTIYSQVSAIRERDFNC